MATKSFNESDEVPAENTALATSSALPDFDAGDISLPRFSIVQKMSDLDFDAPIGSVLVDREAVLLNAGVKTPAVVVRVQKGWKEDIPFDSEENPKQVFTEEARKQLADESAYDIINVAYISVLIQAPADADLDQYPFEFDGSNWQVGTFIAQKKAYDTTFKRLATFSAFNPNTPVESLLWNFSSELVTKGKYKWYVPALAITKATVGEEVKAFVSRLKGE